MASKTKNTLYIHTRVSRKYPQWNQHLQAFITNVIWDDSHMKIREIDGRNALYEHFKWQIKLDVKSFLDVRDWCYTTWGPAVEYQWWNEFGKDRGCEYWSFDTFDVKRRARSAIIYLKGDQELSLFHLKWR